MTAAAAAMGPEHYLDVRELEPPEPLEQALAALRTLRPGDYLRMLHRREPFPLYRLLEQDGFRYVTRDSAASPFEILIWRTDDAAAERAVRQLIDAAP